MDIFEEYEDDSMLEGTEETKEKEFTKLDFNFEESADDTGSFEEVLKNSLQDKKGNRKPSGELKEGVSGTFGTIFECVQKCGGLDIEIFRRITVNSNSYAEENVVRGQFVGYKWQPITTAEMI